MPMFLFLLSSISSYSIIVLWLFMFYYELEGPTLSEHIHLFATGRARFWSNKNQFKLK